MEKTTSEEKTTVAEKTTEPETTAVQTTAPVAETTKEPEKLSCTISIECHSILANKNLVKNPGILACAGNGTILPATEVEFTAGETVFDVLKRVCTAKHIPLSFQFTPLYGSYYIQAINGIEEFDVGELSGWMYQVNGWHPNFGCSSYALEDGDIIEWQYTCDLGYDVGGGYDGE